MSAITFRPDIQGLRAIAVIAVMVFHFNPAWMPGGFIGVDVFLVISGFLITCILLNRKAQDNYSLKETLRYFFTSRITRIAPAYFVMLILVALVAAVLFLPQDFDTFQKGLAKAAWFNSNSYFADFADYFAPVNHEQPLLHTWSLAVEMQFYLLAPFLVLLLPIKLLKWVFALLFFSLTLLAEYRLRIIGIEQTTYYSLYARLPEFFAGSLVALYAKTLSRGKDKSPIWLSMFGMTLILLSAVAQPSLGAFPGIAALLPVVGSMLLLSAQTQGSIERVLSSKLLVWLGALSYSLYLWHWPVLAFLRYYSGAEVLSMGLSLLFVGLTLVLSLASYYWIEKPFRLQKIKKKQVLSWTLLVGALFGTPQSMARVNEVLTPKQLPIEYRRYADASTICHGRIVDKCLRGDLTSEREVLVLGDSHAAMLNHFFDYLGEELGFKARIITASGCVTIPGFDYQRIAEWARQPCLRQIEVARAFTENNTQTIFIAGVWNSQTRSADFNAALEAFIQNNMGKQLIILSQIPRFRRDLNRVQRFSDIGLPAQIERDPSYQIANGLLAELAEGYAHVDFWHMDRLPVFDEAPFYHGQPIYRDEHHINEFGARIYAEAAAQYFYTLSAHK